MAKLLFLCRHAEAEDPLTGQSDYGRCLTAVGIGQARQTALWLQYRFRAEAIVCSPAERTQQTARLLAATLGVKRDSIMFKPELYNAPAGTISNIIMQLPDTLQAVVLVGHNPGITKVLEELTGSQTGYLDPGSLAAVSFETDNWQQTAAETGKLLEIFRPGKW